MTIPVHNREGKEIDSLKVDEAIFGGRVRHALLKQAIVMYNANKRVGTAATKNRSLVEGSTRKLYKQKGTGNARAGTVRTNIRRGGGVAFAKAWRDFGKDMPKKQRQLATDSAILSKMKVGNLVVIDELNFEKPKTKDFVKILGNLKIERTCVVAIKEQNDNLLMSARNVRGIAVMKSIDLNAGDILNRQKMLFTKDAFVGLIEKVKN
ncbi:MAG: 50S ribosomal protein L4 [Planctomycetes bacterium GWF2_42_9]|nr:MAG: 50S ribosomal protein L4 [Planctomycetes bacterium GWF2_42_9]